MLVSWLLVPSAAFRSMSLEIMLVVVFVLAATLTLLPAVLAKLGPRVDKLALPRAHSGEHRSARFAAGGERLCKRPLIYGAIALAILVALAIPVTQPNTAMPSIKVVPPSDSSRVGYAQVQSAMGPGATGPLQIVAPAGLAEQASQVARQDRGIAALAPVQASSGWDRMHDPRDTMVGGRAHSGRVIFAAGAVMVAVFLTFALSGPLRLKEMGIILRRGRTARRGADPPAAPSRAPAPDGQMGVKPPALGPPRVARVTFGHA